MKKRNEFIDILKGYAILLVVLGHSLQYGCGILSNNQFFSNNIFKLIYTFHMPLFVLISGYLFYFSEKKRSLFEIIKSKFLGLIVPLLSFDIVLFIIFVLMGKVSFSFNSFFNIFLTRYWFFFTIFILSILVSFVCKTFKDKYSIPIFIILYFITFFIPDVWQLHLINYSYPFFVIGYLVCRYKLLDKKFVTNHLFIYFLIFNIIFIIMFIFFKDNYYIYITNHFLLNGNGKKFMLFVDIYRFIIGLFGSISSIINIYYLKKLVNKFNYVFDIFIKLGKNSLGIYGISSIIFETVFVSFSYIFKFNYFLVSIEAVIVLILCLIIIKILSKYKITNKLFLGGK